MDKSEIFAFIILFLIASSGLVYMIYSEDIGEAKYLGKRITKSIATPTPAPAPPAPTPISAPSAEPKCTEVIINGPPEDKINVIFIGINYPDNALFAQHVNIDIDWNGQGPGLFSFEPYKTYKEYFNFYRVDYHNNTFDCLGRGTGDACGGAPYENIRSFVNNVCGQKLFGKGSTEGMRMMVEEPFIEVLIHDPSMGSSGFSPIGQRVSLMWSSGTLDIPKKYGKTFTHEFGGHALVGLQDEYIGTAKEPTQTVCNHPSCQQVLQAMGYGGDRSEEQAPNCDKEGCAKWASLISPGNNIGCAYWCGGYSDLYHPTKCHIIVDHYGDPVRKPEIGKDGTKYWINCSIMDGPSEDYVPGVNNYGQKWQINPKEIDTYTYTQFDLVAQIAIKKQIQRQIKYPVCNRSEPACEKAIKLFKLISPVKTPGGYTQGVFDKEKKFTLHQFGIVYDALTSLPADLMSALKLLIFSPHPSLGGGPVSEPETGTLYMGYAVTDYLKTDKALFCTVIHEMGHLIEMYKNVLKPFRSICFDFVNGAWQRKAECEISLDFAPQLAEDGNNWNTELRARSAGADGREDIANSMEYYVCAGDLFRTEARARPKMKEKYQFLKERLFNGREYKCEIDSCLALVPPPTPCANNGCASCSSIGASCTTACNDCPKLAGCAPGMDCNQCYPGHPSCKYWTCKFDKCGINE